MHKWLSFIAVSMAAVFQSFGTTLLQDDFTGREPGTPLYGTAVQSGTLSREYDGKKGWSFVYGDGFIFGEEVDSGVANRSISIPVAVSEVPRGEDLLVFEVTADPSVYRKKPSFALQFGLIGSGPEEIMYTLQSTPSGATRCYAKYTDRNEKIHGLLGMTTLSKTGGPATCAIEYNRILETVSLIVDGEKVVSDLSLAKEFGSAPAISALRFGAIRAGMDTQGKKLFSAYRLESRASVEGGIIEEAVETPPSSAAPVQTVDHSPLKPQDAAVEALVDTGKWRTHSSAQVRTDDDGWIHVGYDGQAGKTMDLVPQEPMPLPDDLSRIKLWYAEPLGETDISFLIRDAAGELHDVTVTHDTGIQPWAVGWDGQKRGDWAMWTATESVSLRMPSEKTLDERMVAEDAAAAKAMLWPKPWDLAGIRLTKGKTEWGSSGSDRNAVKDGTGEILLAGLTFETQDSFEAKSYGQIIELLRWARNEPMPLFLDDLVFPEGRGSYSGPIGYSVKVRKGYQGPLVWEKTGEGVLDRQDPVALKKQAINLPELPEGNYFVQTDAFGKDGSLLETRLHQWQVVEGPDADLKSITENLRVETGRPNNVFSSDTRQAVLNILQDDAAGTELYEVEINDFTGKPVIQQEITKDALAPLAVPVEPGCDYFMSVKAIDSKSSGKVQEVALLHFGVKNAPEPDRESIEMPGLDELLGGKNQPHVEYWTREQAEQRYPWYSNLDVEDMKNWADHVKTFGWDILAVRTIWTDLEMLPGVVRFKELDEVLTHIRGNGQKYMLGCSIWGNRGEMSWSDWVPCRDQYGDLRLATTPAAPFDKESKQAKNQSWVKLAKHYKDDPNMVGYHILGASMTGSVRPEELRIGYEKSSQEAFAKWLTSKGREVHPVTELLTVPMRRVTDLGPDLSTGWLNSTEFFAYANRSTTEGYLAAIRSVDTQRPVIVDRKPFPWAVESLIPILQKDGNAALKNEGSPRFGDVVLRTMSIQAGVPYLGELHRHIPSSKSLVDVINLWESLWADYGFWIQRWRYAQFMEQWASRSDPLRNEVPEVLEFMTQTQSNWDQYMAEPYEVPDVLVFCSHASENLGGQRRGFFDDLTGMASFSALFRQHQVPVLAASEYTDWVKLDDFKVVFVEGEIQTQQALDRLVDYAKAGGKLVMVGDAGKFTVRNLSQRDYLQKTVGKLPNVRRIAPPERLVVDGEDAWAAPSVFNSKEVDAILKWAGVIRPAEITCDKKPGFEVATRRSADGKHVYVAAMRSWTGWYRNRIEKEDVLRELFGIAKGTVTVNGLPDGKWQVRKFHREPKELGVLKAKDGTIQFDTDDAVAAEVQLYELTQIEP